MQKMMCSYSLAVSGRGRKMNCQRCLSAKAEAAERKEYNGPEVSVEKTRGKKF